MRVIFSLLGYDVCLFYSNLQLGIPKIQLLCSEGGIPAALQLRRVPSLGTWRLLSYREISSKSKPE